MINNIIMKNLIDHFNERLHHKELNEFIDNLDKTEAGRKFQEQVEKAETEELKTYVTANFILKSYLLAKISQLEEKVEWLEKKNADLS